MQTKSFDDYLAKRLSKTEINEIEKQAKREKIYLTKMQQQIAQVITEYMDSEEIGFNELVRRLDISPTKAANIKKGKANLTLASIAHLCALLNKEPRFVVKN